MQLSHRPTPVTTHRPGHLPWLTESDVLNVSARLSLRYLLLLLLLRYQSMLLSVYCYLSRLCDYRLLRLLEHQSHFCCWIMDSTICFATGYTVQLWSATLLLSRLSSLLASLLSSLLSTLLFVSPVCIPKLRSIIIKGLSRQTFPSVVTRGIANIASNVVKVRFAKRAFSEVAEVEGHL